MQKESTLTIAQIIGKDPVYLNDWTSKDDLLRDFEQIYSNDAVDKLKDANEKYKDVNILFASYAYEDYSGDAFVLFEQDGKLFEVNGGHCSCYGLEGQWEPEEVILVELENRVLNGLEYSGSGYKDELKQFLGL